MKARCIACKHFKPSNYGLYGACKQAGGKTVFDAHRLRDCKGWEGAKERSCANCAFLSEPITAEGGLCLHYQAPVPAGHSCNHWRPNYQDNSNLVIDLKVSNEKMQAQAKEAGLAMKSLVDVFKAMGVGVGKGYVPIKAVKAIKVDSIFGEILGGDEEAAAAAADLAPGPAPAPAPQKINPDPILKPGKRRLILD